jgi:hypothetical protein
MSCTLVVSPIMSDETVPMLLLSGPPGVGKSTVAWEIFDQLVARDDRPALADLDLLGACWPAPEDDPYNERLRATNLAAVWANYRATGARCLIVDGVIETRALRDAYVAAIPGAMAILCRLSAGDGELGRRIERRGRERGDGVARLTRRAVELSRQLESDDCADLTVDTNGREVVEVATEVLRRTGWPARAARGSSG